VKLKANELTGAALDWAVAKCIYEPDDVVICDGRVFAYDDATKGFNPATNWAQGGPIIEREGMALNMEDTHEWRAAMWWDDEDSKGDILMVGPTPLIAAMRCYVASKLGDEVEVPDELQGEIA
jgi:hypothetical protein